jgi:hypothetical protein
MGYYVKYKELQAAQKSIFNQISKWNTELENTKQKIQMVATMEEIKGEAATSLKSYMQEIHMPLIQYLEQLLTEYMSRMLIYGNEYYKMDTKLNAKMEHERFQEQIGHIISGMGAFQNIESSVSVAIGMAAGLADVSKPSGERITGSYERLGHKATTLMNDIGNWEYSHLSADFGTMEDMLSGITQIVNGQRGKTNVTITTYQAGSIAKVPAFQKLQQTAAKQSANLEGSTKDLEDAINGYTKRQQERDLADQRTQEGEMQMLEGTLIAATAILSAVAIVATFGAATPVVVGAFAVASASGLYGMSNANEGLNNVMLGRSGDSTTAAMNPIRDTLFASNPNLYYTVGNASTMVCTLAVPVGGAASSAMKAGTSVVKAISVEGGKIALSSVAGSATTDAVYKKTNNQIFATIAGMGVGSLAYGGMTKYDTAKNISGYHAKSTVENVAKNANSKGGTDAKYISRFGEMTKEDAIRYDGYWKWKEVEGTPKFKNGSIYDGWYKKDGTMNYPPNNGSIPGTEEIITLGNNNVLSVGRYGKPGPNSVYVTQSGASSSSLSLPPNTDPSTYINYKIVKPIPNVEQATIAPWVGDPGLGIQYKLPKTINWYIEHGYLLP